jgi:hypothetical protein
MLTSGFSVNRLKKLIFVLVIFVLVAFACYFLINKSHQKKPLTSLQKTYIANLGRESCNKNLKNVNDINAKKIEDQDSIFVLSYRANCYFELNKYQQAKDAYKQLQDTCTKMGNSGCAASAQSSIDAVNDAMKQSDSMQQPNKSKSTLVQ